MQNNDASIGGHEYEYNDSSQVAELNALIQNSSNENIFVNNNNSIHLTSSHASSNIKCMQQDKKQNLEDESKHNQSVISCKCLKRLADALKEYEICVGAVGTQTKDENEKPKQHKSLKALTKLYESINIVDLLNDFNHLIQFHSHEFEQIYHILKLKIHNNKPCDLSSCRSITRNNRDRNKETQTKHYELYFTNNIQEIMLLQCIDRIHCHYFHSIDAGYKLSKHEKQMILSDLTSENNDEKSNDTQRMDLVTDDKIEIFSESQTQWFEGVIVDIYNDKNDEWLAIKYSNPPKIKEIGRYSKFIRPILESDEKSNVNNAYLRDRVMQRISRLIRNKKRRYKKIEQRRKGPNKFVSRSAAYKFGCRFFYHKPYKDLKRHDDPVGIAANLQGIFIMHEANDGIPMSKMYVPAKYENMKEELTSNSIFTLDISQWNNEEQKAVTCSQTDFSRDIFCCRTKSAKYYEMKYKTRLKMDHIIAASIYCNYDNLQREFSKTYWPLSQHEDLEDIKLRHMNYYWLGRSLRELVECFGMDPKKKKNIRFYHGINLQMNFTTLFAYIKGPCSTTDNVAVAAGFCENQGILMEFDIDVKSWVFKILEDGPDAMSRICCFDMRSFSDYVYESEVFTIGGLNRFHFNSIINVNTNINYGIYLKALRQMTSGMSHGGISCDYLNVFIPQTNREKMLVYKLLAHQFWKYKKFIPDLKDEFAMKFERLPLYIEDLMDSHCKQIKLISFFNSKPKHKVLEWFFKDDNGLIKLKHLMTIFPNADYLRYNFTFDQLRKNNKDITLETPVYESILSFIDENKDSKLMHIHFGIDPNNAEEIERFVRERYEAEFDKRGWNIDIVHYGINDWNHSLANSVDLSALGIQPEQFDLGKMLQNKIYSVFIKAYIASTHTMYDLLEKFARAGGLEEEQFDVTKHYHYLEQHVLKIDKQTETDSDHLDVD